MPSPDLVWLKAMDFRGRSAYSAGRVVSEMTEVPPPTEELIQQLSSYELRVGELALGLREVILQEAPAATETIFRSYALAIWYSFSGRMTESFCYIGVSSNHVNLGFYRGVDLEDPKGLLEGSGKQMRHVKIRRPDDLKNPYLRKFIRASMKNSKPLASSKRARSTVSTSRPRRR